MFPVHPAIQELWGKERHVGEVGGCSLMPRTKLCAAFWSCCLHSVRGCWREVPVPFPVPLIKQQLWLSTVDVRHPELFPGAVAGRKIMFPCIQARPTQWGIKSVISNQLTFDWRNSSQSCSKRTNLSLTEAIYLFRKEQQLFQRIKQPLFKTDATKKCIGLL